MSFLSLYSNPNQRGIILQGIVYSAYANWLGTNQFLVLNCITQQFDNVLSSYPIMPITLIGKQNDKLETILINALKNTHPSEKYPDIEIITKISNHLILTEDISEIYEGGL